MDITIRLSPRIIERTILIVIIIALIASNIYFYKNQGVTETTEETTQSGSQSTDDSQDSDTQSDDQTTDTTDSDDDTDTSDDSTGSDGCTEGWKCKTPYYKAYQNADCSWDSIAACVDGCESGECVETE